MCTIVFTDEQERTHALDYSEFFSFKQHRSNKTSCTALLHPEIITGKEFQTMMMHHSRDMNYKLAEGLIADLFKTRHSKLFLNEYTPPEGNGKGFFLGGQAMYTSVNRLKVL